MAISKKGLTRLHKLEAKEVSLVPEGANGKRFMIFKSAGGTLAKNSVAKSVSAELHKLISKTDPSIMKKVDEMMKEHSGVAPEPEPEPAPQEPAEKAAGPMDEQAQAAVKAIVRILAPFKEKIPAALMHSILDEVGFAVEEAGEDEADEHHNPEGHADAALADDAAAEGEPEEQGSEGENEDTAEMDSSEAGEDEVEHSRHHDEEDEEDEDEEDEEMEKASNHGRDDFFGQQDEDDLDPDEGEEENHKVGKDFMALPAHLVGKVKKEHMVEAHKSAANAYGEDLAKSVQDNEAVTAEHLMKAHKHAMAMGKQHLEKLGYRMYPDAEVQMKNKDGKPVSKSKGETVAKQKDATSLDGLDEKTRKALEPVFKQHKELVQKNADLEARLAAQTASIRDKELVEKAASFAFVGLPQEEIVATLKDADKIGKESFERVVKSFSTLNEQGKTSKLFEEKGSSLSAGGAVSWEKIEAAAKTRVAKSGEKMTKEQAVESFMLTDEGRAMYADYKASRKDGI